MSSRSREAQRALSRAAIQQKELTIGRRRGRDPFCASSLKDTGSFCACWHAGCRGKAMRTVQEQIEQKAILVPAGEIELAGDLSLPEHARGIVLFAHGSG